MLLNDDDLSYAKVRLVDYASRAALVEPHQRVARPVGAAITWSLFWDSVRDAEVAPQEFGLPRPRRVGQEKDMAAVTTVLAEAAACSGHLSHRPRNRGNRRGARLVAGLAGLLQGCRAGVGRPAHHRQDPHRHLPQRRTRWNSSRCGYPARRCRPIWSVDTDLRWRIVTALARAGVFGEEEIAAELERDNTNAGAERAAGARAGIPTARREVRRLAARHRRIASVPNETHRSIASGFVHYGQGVRGARPVR